MSQKELHLPQEVIPYKSHVAIYHFMGYVKLQISI